MNWEWKEGTPETSVVDKEIYIIKSVGRDSYLRMNPAPFCNISKDPRSASSDDTQESYHWMLEKQVGGGFALKNIDPATSKYLSTTSNRQGFGTDPSDTPVEFSVTYIEELNAFTITKEENGVVKYLSYKEDYHITFTETAPTSENKNACWTLHKSMPRTTETLKDGGYYLIYNACASDYYGHFFLYDNGSKIANTSQMDAKDFNDWHLHYIWQVEKQEDTDVYFLKNLATGAYASVDGNTAHEAGQSLKITNAVTRTAAKGSFGGQTYRADGTKSDSDVYPDNDVFVITSTTDDNHNWTSNWGHTFAINDYGPQGHAFYEVPADLLAAYNNAQAALNLGSGVGYPTAEERATLEAAMDGLLTELEAAVTAYKTTTNVNLPVNGKAYNIYAVFPDGSRQAMYWDGERISTSASVTADPFVCRITDDSKFVLVNNNGGYLSWFSDEKGHKANVGVTDEYAVVDGKAYNDLTLTRATADKVGGSVQDGTTDATLFGRLHIQGLNTDGDTWYLAVREDGKFIAGNATDKWYDLDTWNNANKYRTVTYTFEEVTYPNTPALKNIESVDMAVGTFSAPFPTVVPAEVKAYYVAADAINSTTAKLTKIPEGKVIPANQGVILAAAKDAESALMVPATSETQSDLTGNLLKPSGDGFAKGAYTDANTTVYVLSGHENKVAFYLAGANTSLGANKAYLEITGGAAAPSLVMNFGGETTGIESIVTESADKAVYDLSGRRIQNPTKGLYIIGGKKVYIK